MDGFFSSIGPGALTTLAIIAMALAALAVLRKVHLKLPGGLTVTPTSDTEPLQEILAEQRRAYDHLVERVETLETKVHDMEEMLEASRIREQQLTDQLADERRKYTTRIVQLEAELAAAEIRIAHLEAELAAALGK